MGFLTRLFRKKIGTCNLCDKDIYAGDYYGYEKETSSLALRGYSEVYFCKACLEKNCCTTPLDESSLGKNYIISKINREKSRITIRREK